MLIVWRLIHTSKKSCVAGSIRGRAWCNSGRKPPCCEKTLEFYFSHIMFFFGETAQVMFERVPKHPKNKRLCNLWKTLGFQRERCSPNVRSPKPQPADKTIIKVFIVENKVCAFYNDSKVLHFMPCVQHIVGHTETENGANSCWHEHQVWLRLLNLSKENHFWENLVFFLRKFGFLRIGFLFARQSKRRKQLVRKKNSLLSEFWK